MTDRKHYITPLAETFPGGRSADVIRTSEWSKPYSIIDAADEFKI